MILNLSDDQVITLYATVLEALLSDAGFLGDNKLKLEEKRNEDLRAIRDMLQKPARDIQYRRMSRYLGESK